MPSVQELPSVYNPHKVENKWYRVWEEAGYFRAPVENRGDRKPFSVVMPPPNVTGSLHLGHALDNTLQDILVRWHRMRGDATLWLPGTDHAGIATQARVEEELAKEGISKYDLGREKFLERVWAWKEEYGTRITQQLRRLGASCDWSRERFTMDAGCSRAVREVFVRLYQEGLIYRGDYIINWCPRCATVISDIEVEHEEEPGHLWYILYPFKEGQGGITVATTRPETMLGDTAVAVHPDDERYREFVGRTVILPLLNREIPVIADEYVDPSFGTGAVKITPAHDPNDFEVGRRHGLPSITVIGKDAIMTTEAGPYVGLDRYTCREKVVKDLETQGYLIKVEEHTHAVGHCYRCGTVIEPLVSPQWFVRMKPLAEPAIQAALEGRVRFVPERFTKIYLNWLENIRDWCISRQLWWGHRIPVWYCQQCGEVICSTEDPIECPACSSTALEQDPDVLDTWFSSALWPFSTMGWPDKTPELALYYPTSVLVTGRDIIFFWVARMLFMGLKFMGEVPFREVLIHGLVLDAQGRKMSKSLGNGVDPMDVIEEYGADTLRFMLITGNTPGNDLRFHPERLESTRNFCNKIWNAARFVLLNLKDFNPEGERAPYTLPDRWILSRLNTVVDEVTKNMEDYEIGEAARSLYEFFWGEFCDWYIELAKIRLYGEDKRAKSTAQKVLLEVLETFLKLLHPFMPFITEEIWHYLPGERSSIMISPWPKAQAQAIDPEAEEAMSLITEVIRAIRNLRSEMRVTPGRKVRVILVAAGEKIRQVLEEACSYFSALAQAEPVEILAGREQPLPKAVSAVCGGVEVYLPLEGLVDYEKEITRLEKELATTQKELARVQGKLANPDFLAKAPAEVVEKERNKAEELQAKEEALRQRLSSLKSRGERD
ncbi:valyl-tRNA synthetase [Thermanaeromonas toyohensis ToBE]|uniref:Valine--tRNA ligase n=1 Tax=Thermanaeromonas toyohensis ToBE TaxID=698762 RepID=A0A1W1VI31_9FIRM|nr:valine--tRNA ligase [Thermanaeromonas toyohensis]SMB92614.1 valyl-tRNA synthetase [Thermanaeromonas toyohensis ToBE]